MTVWNVFFIENETVLLLYCLQLYNTLIEYLNITILESEIPCSKYFSLLLLLLCECVCVSIILNWCAVWPVTSVVFVSRTQEQKSIYLCIYESYRYIFVGRQLTKVHERKQEYWLTPSKEKKAIHYLHLKSPSTLERNTVTFLFRIITIIIMLLHSSWFH